MSLMLRIIRTPLCLILVLYLGVDTAAGQDWKFEPVIRLGGEFDDNASLNIRTDQEVELRGFLLDVAANINYASPATTFYIEPRVLLRSYPDESEFDSDDIFLRSAYEYEGLSNTFGFRAYYDRQSVRTAERNDSDLGVDDPAEIPDTDSGRTIVSGTRNKWRLFPYWDYKVSDTVSVGADLAYITATYEDVPEGSLRDFDDARLSINLDRALSDVMTGSVSLTTRRYETDDSLRTVEGYGFLVGVEYALSGQTRLTAKIGLEDTDQGDFDADPEVVGDATLIRRLETIRLLAQYRRTISASGAGRLSVRDSVSLNFRRRLSEKVSAGLGVRAYQSTGLGGPVAVDDRDYLQLQSEFIWNLTRYFAIQVEYRYTVLDRESLGEQGNSNRINLWFVYSPNSTTGI